MISLMGLLMLLVFAIGGVSAQFNQVFCGDLAEADCAIMQQSQTAALELESSAFDLDMNFTMSGLPKEAGMESIAFGMVANGAFAADPAMMQSIQPASTEEAAKMMTDMQEWLPELIRSLTGTMNVQVSIPEEMKTPDMPELNFDLLMANGVIYFDAATFAGEPEPNWVGIDLAAMYETIFSGMASQMGDMSSFMGLDMITRFSDPAYLNEFMTVTRLADDEVMGQSAAVFEVVLDYGKLFSNEQFKADLKEYMQAMMEMQGASTEGTGAEFAMMVEMMSSMFAGSEMRMHQWIGLTDFYTHHLDMHLNFNMDMSQMAAMTGEEMSDNIIITMDFVLDMSGFNNPVEVTVPEKAQIINPAMFMGMGSMESF